MRRIPTAVDAGSIEIVPQVDEPALAIFQAPAETGAIAVSRPSGSGMSCRNPKLQHPSRQSNIFGERQTNIAQTATDSVIADSSASRAHAPLHPSGSGASTTAAHAIPTIARLPLPSGLLPGLLGAATFVFEELPGMEPLN
jgi:hypothetical protein